jgi:hypothetical protein
LLQLQHGLRRASHSAALHGAETRLQSNQNFFLHVLVFSFISFHQFFDAFSLFFFAFSPFPFCPFFLSFFFFYLFICFYFQVAPQVRLLGSVGHGDGGEAQAFVFWLQNANNTYARNASVTPVLPTAPFTLSVTASWAAGQSFTAVFTNTTTGDMVTRSEVTSGAGGVLQLPVPGFWTDVAGLVTPSNAT